MSANWWADPMPAGWEAKWAPTQNRYFFIDHSTKKTTWVDPRSPEGKHQVRQHPPPAPLQQPAAQPAAQQYGGYGRGSAYNNGAAASNTMQMREVRQTVIPKCNQCNIKKVTTQGDTCMDCVLKVSRQLDQQETSFTRNRQSTTSVDETPLPLFPQADHQLLEKIKESYPSAFESHIRAALESNNNEESKAIHDLEKRGYRKVDKKAQAADKLVQKLRSQYSDCPLDILKSTVISCDSNAEKTEKKLNDLGYYTYQQRKEIEKAERNQKNKREQVERDIKYEFSDLDSTVVQMAIESADYDEDTIRAVLQSLSSEVEGVPEPPSTTQQVTPTPVARPTSAAKGKKAAKKSAQHATQKPTAAAKSAGKSKTVTRPTTAAKTRPNTANQPQSRPTTSQSRTREPVASQKTTGPSNKLVTKSSLAQGPDSSLPRGADDSLLLKGYCAVLGPDRSLACGPTCVPTGTQGAFGPDPTLVQGSSRRMAVMV